MITDAHIHVQPWWELKPEVLEVMTRGRSDVDELHKIRSARSEDLLAALEGLSPERVEHDDESERGRGRQLVHAPMAEANRCHCVFRSGGSRLPPRCDSLAARRLMMPRPERGRQ